MVSSRKMKAQWLEREGQGSSRLRKKVLDCQSRFIQIRCLTQHQALQIILSVPSVKRHRGNKEVWDFHTALQALPPTLDMLSLAQNNIWGLRIRFDRVAWQSGALKLRNISIFYSGEFYNLWVILQGVMLYKSIGPRFISYSNPLVRDILFREFVD